MKILLVGEYYSENLGDPLLCQTVEKVIKEYYPDAEIVPFDMNGKISVDVYYKPKTNPVLESFMKYLCNHYLYYRRAAICRTYIKDKGRCQRVWYRLGELLHNNKFDLVIFAGGSIFMDYFSGIIYLILARLALTRVKILFHACGMSTLNEDGEYLLRRALRSKKIVSISLRDSYERFIQMFPVNAKVQETFDTALCCSRYFAPSDERRTQLGIGMIDRCYDQQMMLIRALLTSNYNWKAFTNGSPYDQAYAEKLLSVAGIPTEKIGEYLIDRPETAEELVKSITGFQKIISFRMHSQIVAASFGIASFGYAWDEKVVTLYEKLGFPQGCAQKTLNLNQAEKGLLQYGEEVHLHALKQGDKSCECLISAIENVMKDKKVRKD